MAGIIMGALGGAGDALREFGSNMQKGAIQTDLENLRSENDLKRTKAVEEFKMEIGNRQRDMTLQRRGAAKERIINSAIEDKYADAKPADASTWTAEQQAAVDQAKGIDRKAMSNDVRTDLRAAMETGEISPKDVATLDQRDAANDTKLAIAELRNQAFQARTEAQYEIAIAKMEAKIAKATGGGKDQTNKEMLSLLDGMRKDIASEASDLKSSMKAELDGLGKFADPADIQKVRDAYKPKLEALALRRSHIQNDFNAMRKKLGLPEVEADNDAPAPQPNPVTPPANRPPLSSFQK